MTQLRSVNTHFWNDSFIADCSPDEKLIFLYLLTNESTTLAGCYEISVKRIAFDTDISKDAIEVALKKFQSAGKIEYRDGWLVLNSFHKHQNLNPNMGTAAGKVLKTAPQWVRNRIQTALEGIGTLPEWFPNPSETVKGREEKGKEIEDEGEEPPANGFESVEPDLLIKQTEDVLRIKLTPDQKKNLCAAIPNGFVLMWIPFLRGRMTGLKTRERPELKLGFWLTDFQRDYKNEYEKLRKPQPKLLSASEKIAADEARRRANPIKPPPADFVQGMRKQG